MSKFSKAAWLVSELLVGDEHISGFGTNETVELVRLELNFWFRMPCFIIIVVIFYFILEYKSLKILC